MKEDMKKIKHQFNNKGHVIQLEVKCRIKFGTKISLMILKTFEEGDGWSAAEAFDLSKAIPNDTHQFLMVLGINDSAYLSASDRVKPFLLEMGWSNLSWEVP